MVRKQIQEYINEVLPPLIKKRLAVEAGTFQGWLEWVGNEGEIIAIDKFGSSAPYKELYQHYGFTVDYIMNTKEGNLYWFVDSKAAALLS